MQAENVDLFFLSHEGFSKTIQSRAQKSVRPEFTVYLQLVANVWFGECHFTSLNLSILVSKMRS